MSPKIRRRQEVIILSLLVGILSSMVSCQHHTEGVHILESIPAKASVEPVVAKNPLPKISFESTVCDLGQGGQGTNNTCEFKFTNTGRGALEIAKVKALSVF